MVLQNSSSSCFLTTTPLWLRPLICWQSGSFRWVNDHKRFCLCLHQNWPFYHSSDLHQNTAVIYHVVVPGCRCWAGSGPRASGKSPQEPPDKTLWPPESWFHLHCWRRGEILGKQLSKYRLVQENGETNPLCAFRRLLGWSRWSHTPRGETFSINWQRLIQTVWCSISL